MNRAIDFDTVNAQALTRLPELLHQWFPAGKQHGQEFRIGDLSGTPGESLSVNIQTGQWADFATDHRGGDPVSLNAARLRINQQESAALLARELGILQAAPPTASRPKSRSTKPVWTPILPVPDDAPPPSLDHFRFGAPSRHWVYRNADGQALGHVCRFDYKGGKETWPLSFCQSDKGQRSWKWKGLPVPRPLFNLDKLAARPDLPVLIVEGEKTAEAAESLFPDHIPVTSPFGSKSADKADWSPLTGRDIVIWPDHDTPGHNYANAVARQLQQHQTTAIRIISVPDAFPKGWDLADPVPEGFSGETLNTLLKNAASWEPATDPDLLPFPDGNLPEIRWLGGQLPTIMAETEQALLNAVEGETVYQRGGQLVRVVRIARPEVQSGIRKNSGSLNILPVESVWLQVRLTEVAEWWKFDGRSGDWKQINAPMEVAKALIAKTGKWKLPQLVAVTETPTLRPDGTILDRPGFDQSTGLLFDPGDTTFRAIHANPSRDQAKKALAWLEKLLAGFPFREPAHQSVAIAAILTSLVRRSLRTAPMFVFSAPKMGSGKSLLADVVALIATGLPATVMTHATNNDEERKRLLAILMEGDAVACIDNIERPLGSETLCSILTQTAYKDRVLGESRNVSVPTLTTWMATGNNITVAGDLSTRVVICHLDPQVERPEERHFKVNLYQTIPQHRAELVTAGLTILRAYIVAGKPDQNLPPFGRFEEWSALVRSALVWMGLPDPLMTRQVVESGDPVREQLRTIMQTWYESVGSSPMSTSEIVAHARQQAKPARDWHNPERDQAEENPELLNVLQEITGSHGVEINTRRLGKWLARYENRIEEGMRFEKADMLSSTGTTKWRIRRL